MSEVTSDAPLGAKNRQFATTQWSMVLSAGVASGTDAQDALAQLCETYWYPLYAYVRRRGYTADDAQDLTQAFFARLLEKRTVQMADPQRGRFRSFLLASMDHFLANEKDRAQAKKRGGDRAQMSFDLASAEARVSLEPSHEITPERLFMRQWTLTLLDVVVARLEEEFRDAGKSRRFELLRDALTGNQGRLPYADLADQLGMTAEALRQAAQRMRKRFRTLLREEVARTVDRPGDVDGEIRSLFESLEN